MACWSTSSLGLSEHASSEGITFKADPTLAGGTVVATQREESKLVFDFVPSQGTARVDAVFELACSSKPEVLKLGFGVSQPEAGKNVSILSLE
ncbi:MAG: hypothetical protein QM765_38100 [Myxococcales bacterium]